jgi:hypothetical protein
MLHFVKHSFYRISLFEFLAAYCLQVRSAADTASQAFQARRRASNIVKQLQNGTLPCGFRLRCRSAFNAVNRRKSLSLPRNAKSNGDLPAFLPAAHVTKTQP